MPPSCPMALPLRRAPKWFSSPLQDSMTGLWFGVAPQTDGSGSQADIPSEEGATIPWVRS